MFSDAELKADTQNRYKIKVTEMISAHIFFSPFLTISLSLCVSFPPLIAGLGDNNHVLSSLSVGVFIEEKCFFEFEVHKRRARRE